MAALLCKIFKEPDSFRPINLLFLEWSLSSLFKMVPGTIITGFQGEGNRRKRNEEEGDTKEPGCAICEGSTQNLLHQRVFISHGQNMFWWLNLAAREP